MLIILMTCTAMEAINHHKIITVNGVIQLFIMTH